MYLIDSQVSMDVTYIFNSRQLHRYQYFNKIQTKNVMYKTIRNTDFEIEKSYRE